MGRLWPWLWRLWRPRIVVTGLGAVTPLALGASRTWQRLLAGRSGIVSLASRNSPFEKNGCRVAGLVPRGQSRDGAWNSEEWLTKEEFMNTTQYMQYAMYAAREALDDAGWHPKTELEQKRTGICLGTGIGSFKHNNDAAIEYDAKTPKRVSPFYINRLLLNMAAGHISVTHSIKGPCKTNSEACATGAYSIGNALDLITLDRTSVVLAGASESCIEPLAFVGFESSRSLNTSSNHDPPVSSRPFDSQRSGFVIGEGAAMLVLESLDHALSRGARIYAEVVGQGLSSDAYRLTAPPEDGGGAFRAMENALEEARLKPKDVDYINAHATSTVIGDQAENKAIRRLMLGDGSAEGKKRASDINVSSTKGATGHLLGAAGALEAIFSVLAIHDGVLPPTLNLDMPGTGLSTEGFDLNYVPRVKQEREVNVVLSNSFGFGGVNASLCFKKYKQ